jgi:hypothetical protein
MPITAYPVDEATTDIRDLQRMPTTGLIEVDDSAAVSFCVCLSPITDERPAN